MSTEDWYAKSLAQLWAKPEANEADLSGALIRPVLANELGFGVAEIDAESETVSGTGKRIRPDFVCGNPNTEFAYVIVEVKRLGTALDQRKGRQGMSTSPAGQLRRYLKGHRRAGVGTWGVLTNGTDWLVVQRTDEDCPWDAFGDIRKASTLAEVRALLAPIRSGETPADSETSARRSRRRLAGCCRRLRRAVWFLVVCGTRRGDHT